MSAARYSIYTPNTNFSIKIINLACHVYNENCASYMIILDGHKNDSIDIEIVRSLNKILVRFVHDFCVKTMLQQSTDEGVE